jgi:hypothetical protein
MSSNLRDDIFKIQSIEINIFGPLVEERNFEKMIYFVTGNDKKWKEIESVLSSEIEIKRANIDCK